MSSFIYGFPGDSLGYLVYIHHWLSDDLPRAGFWSSFFLPPEPRQILLRIFLDVPALVLGPIGAFNLVLVVTFLTNFLLSFWMARRWLSFLASLITAVLVSTSLFVQWQATRSLEMAMLFWLLPLYLFLWRFWQAPDMKNVFFVSLFCALSFLNSFHLGYFALILSVVVILLNLIKQIVKDRQLKLWLGIKYLAIFVLVFTLISLPALLPVLRYYRGDLRGNGSNELSEAIKRNKLEDLVAYGARPWDYLLPSIYHPLWGSGVVRFYDFLKDSASYQFWSPYLPERANYLTWAGLILAIFAVISVWKRRLDQSRQVIFLLGITLLMFWLSLPAVIHFKLISFYSPSFFLFRFFPMFRVYSRAGIFVLIGTAFLAGFGWQFLLGKIKTDEWKLRLGGLELVARKSVLLTLLVVGLIIFENLNFPPFAVVDLSNIPKVYQWLKVNISNKSDTLMIEYPKDNTGNDYGGGCPKNLASAVLRDYNGIYEDYYQTYHGLKVFDYQKLPKPERALLPSLDRAAAYDVLKKYHVNYLVIHSLEPLVAIHSWPYPQDNPLDSCWRRRIMVKPARVYPGFVKVADFDDGTVYRIQ